jgi:hypothetical protein
MPKSISKRMERGSNSQGFRSLGFESSAVANFRLVHPTAETVGFEPTRHVSAYTLSRRALSTTQAHLQKEGQGFEPWVLLHTPAFKAGAFVRSATLPETPGALTLRAMTRARRATGL